MPPKKNTPLSPKDGLPDPLSMDVDEHGICTICLRPCRVGIHKGGHYYTACRACSFRSFSASSTGNLLFRAMQRVLKNAEIRDVLTTTLEDELEKLTAEVMAATLTAAASTGGPTK